MVFTLLGMIRLPVNPVQLLKACSPIYVTFSILGNLSYLLSLFIKDTRPQFCWNQAPWLVGASFPMICDITFLIQMCVWGTDSVEENIELENIGDGVDEDEIWIDANYPDKLKTTQDIIDEFETYKSENPDWNDEYDGWEDFAEDLDYASFERG